MYFLNYKNSTKYIAKNNFPSAKFFERGAGRRISYDCLAASYEFRYASHSYDLASPKLKLHRQSYHNVCVSKLITCEALITLNYISSPAKKPKTKNVYFGSCDGVDPYKCANIVRLLVERTK